MKSIAKKISACFMVCIMILAVCGNTNIASAYELTEADEYELFMIN